ncbi:MAG: tRNA pseudouridine(55) synthase TruB [Mangrovibacterium sp.]
MDFQEGEILLFDKELDWTSFDLVRKVRNKLCRELGVKKLKVGHAGTLDPKATGLMILCTGKATKKIESIQAEIKEYITTLKLGATTPSFDLESDEDEQYPTEHITRELLQEVLVKFTGEQQQTPPIFSAVRVNGKRAYEHARKGDDIELTPKKIRIDTLEILSFQDNLLELRVVCSKGTYIRALARDIGNELKSGAYLVQLRRTQIGAHRVENALDLNYFLENIPQFISDSMQSSTKNG